MGQQPSGTYYLHCRCAHTGTYSIVGYHVCKSCDSITEAVPSIPPLSPGTGCENERDCINEGLPVCCPNGSCVGDIRQCGKIGPRIRGCCSFCWCYRSVVELEQPGWRTLRVCSDYGELRHIYIYITNATTCVRCWKWRHFADDVMNSSGHLAV